VSNPERDIPTPVLLHFVPVPMAVEDGRHGVAISGEILTEPTSWTEGQTQRHRMETLGRMTMGMAHDFNNLLSGILGHIELWRLESPPDESQEHHLTTIEKAAASGADLIARIQRYIRQEAQSVFEPIDLNSLIEDCIQFTRPYWYNEPRRQGIDIEVSLTKADLPPIDGSRAELRDVFVNLILNAIHALPAGGTITFTTQLDGSEAVVRVADSGTGMPDHVRARVFEPLFSTKGEQGNGMGLAVAAGTMREHGGSISVDSDPGIGTTFTLRFPAALDEEDQLDSHHEEASDEPVKARSILVVDDEDMVRNVVCRLLRVRGHAAFGVSSGQEALEALDKDPYDLVLTDQGMPGMTGRELARQIRKVLPDMPIMLLTGDTELAVNPAEIDRVLTKPFRIDDVESAIGSLT